MFFFAGGLNDGRRPDGFTRSNIEAEIDTLYGMGARRFMVANLPTKIPGFAAAGMKINPDLEKIPDEERAKHSDIRIANSHWGSFFDEVIANPAKYGLTDTTSPCAQRDFRGEQVRSARVLRRISISRVSPFHCRPPGGGGFALSGSGQQGSSAPVFWGRGNF